MRLGRVVDDAEADGEPELTKGGHHESNGWHGPVSLLAASAVDRRLKRVARLLPRAAKHPERDVEYVHDLRVASRRAAATLRLFEPWLPQTASRKMQTRLNRIRRAAGPARDLDVIEERLSRLAAAGGATAQLVAAVDRVQVQRAKAQKPIRRSHRKARKQDWLGRRARSLSERVEWRGQGHEPLLQNWAGTALLPSLQRFVDRSFDDLTDPRALHRMRIAEKRVRYSLEALDGAPESPFDDVMPVLTELQKRLGEINDHRSAHFLMLRWRDRSGDEGMREVFAHLAAFERWLGSYAHDKFLEWWTPARRLDFHVQLSTLCASMNGPGIDSQAKALRGGLWNLTRPTY